MYNKFMGHIVQKSSNLSIKLPEIQKNVHGDKNNRNNYNCNNNKNHDYSLQSININNHNIYKKQMIIRSQSITQRAVKLIQQKLKSRIKNNKIKTQNCLQKQSQLISNPSQCRQIVDNTLINFKKNIQANRQYIHQEIYKRMHQSSIVHNSDKGIGIYKQKQSKRKSKLIKRKKSCTETQVFQDIQKIISKPSNTATCTIDLNQIEQKIRMADLRKNLKKMSPQQSLQEIREYFMSEGGGQRGGGEGEKKNKIVLKNLNNYHQWRRVNISLNQITANYGKSTLQIENQRLSKLALQTEASISRYLQTKKHLLQLKLTPLKTSL